MDDSRRRIALERLSEQVRTLWLSLDPPLAPPPPTPRESRKPGQKRASKKSIEAMPRIKVREVDEECPICLEEMAPRSQAGEMACKHAFHSECIERWLAKHVTCPLCRFVMPEEETSDTEEEPSDEDTSSNDEEDFDESEGQGSPRRLT